MSSRIKNIIVITIALFLVTPYIANASNKITTSCKKINQTTTIANIKYTCVKSGKKLVWDKGVAIKNFPVLNKLPQSLESQDLTEIKVGDQCSSVYRGTTKVISNITLLCKHDDISAFRWYRVDNLPTVITTPGIPIAPINSTGPINAITLDNLDSEWTYKIAYSRITEFANNQALPNIKNNLILSPTVENRPYKIYLQGIEEIAKVMSSIYKNPNFSTILFTEKDSEWIDRKQSELMGSYLNNPTQQLQSYRIKEYGCNIGGFYLPNIIVFCIKQETDFDLTQTGRYSAEGAMVHEFTHLVGMTSPDASSFSPGSPGRLKPCWIEEGFATFYGEALGGSKIDSDGKLRILFLNQLTYSYDFKRNQQPGTIKKILIQKNETEVINLFKELEQTMNTCTEVHNAYLLGSLAAEALVAVYGANSLNDFQLELGKTGNWKISFEKIFKIKVEDFYIKLIPYLASQASKFSD